MKVCKLHICLFSVTYADLSIFVLYISGKIDKEKKEKGELREERKEEEKGQINISSINLGLRVLTPWIAACQVILSMGFPREEYWSGFPFPSPGEPLDPGIKLASPELAGKFFTTESPGKSPCTHS